MKETGILMSRPMVRQTRAGAKLTTRRVSIADSGRCPFGVAGDLLWVREAWRLPPEYDKFSGNEAARIAGAIGRSVTYVADEDDIDPLMPWSGRYRHARFMPRWASRLLLQITSIDLQRLCTITRESVRREGLPLNAYDARAAGFDLEGWDDYDSLTAVQNFARLWDSLNLERGAGWETNPYVWVVDFKLLTGEK